MQFENAAKSPTIHIYALLKYIFYLFMKDVWKEESYLFCKIQQESPLYEGCTLQELCVSSVVVGMGYSFNSNAEEPDCVITQ